MKKVLYTVIMAVVAITMLDSCLGKSVEDEYKDWRQNNDEWYQLQAASGQYTQLTAPWDPSAQVLIRWHNNRELTRDNLVPLVTSTVDVKYLLRLYDGTRVDSSYTSASVTRNDSIYRTLQKSTLSDFQQTLRTLVCQWAQPFRHSSGKNNTNHKYYVKQYLAQS